MSVDLKIIPASRKVNGLLTYTIYIYIYIDMNTTLSNDVLVSALHWVVLQKM